MFMCSFVKIVHCFILRIYNSSWFLFCQKAPTVIASQIAKIVSRTDVLKSIKVNRRDPRFIDLSGASEQDKQELLKDSTPMVYICATMWHENEQEMIYMLKSIFRSIPCVEFFFFFKCCVWEHFCFWNALTFVELKIKSVRISHRLDRDQCVRKNVQEQMDVVVPDYYEFEGQHKKNISLIFFSFSYEADHIFRQNREFDLQSGCVFFLIHSSGLTGNVFCGRCMTTGAKRRETCTVVKNHSSLGLLFLRWCWTLSVFLKLPILTVPWTNNLFALQRTFSLTMRWRRTDWTRNCMSQTNSSSSLLASWIRPQGIYVSEWLLFKLPHSLIKSRRRNGTKNSNLNDDLWRNEQRKCWKETVLFSVRNLYMVCQRKILYSVLCTRLTSTLILRSECPLRTEVSWCGRVLEATR